MHRRVLVVLYCGISQNDTTYRTAINERAVAVMARTQLPTLGTRQEHGTFPTYWVLPTVTFVHVLITLVERFSPLCRCVYERERAKKKREKQREGTCIPQITQQVSNTTYSSVLAVLELCKRLVLHLGSSQTYSVVPGRLWACTETRTHLRDRDRQGALSPTRQKLCKEASQ